MKSEIFFTVCNGAYLGKALVLAESLFRRTGYTLRIYLFETTIPEIHDVGFALDIKLACEQDFDRFYELAFKYDVTEFTTALKPYLAIQLIEEYQYVIFLDPDTFVIGEFKALWDTLNSSDIVLTPHYLKPESNTKLEPDLAMMRFGSFNMGFFAVKQSRQGLEFLDWWHSRCVDQCFFETQFGLSTDQKWVSIAPCFFDRISILRDPGFNVAFWNLQERKISCSEKGCFVNNSFELVFFHFSSFSDGCPEKITTRAELAYESIGEDLVSLAHEYANRCEYFNKIIPDSCKKYSYDYFDSGDEITVTLRRAFACNLEKFKSETDPFSEGSDVYKFAKRNFLLTKDPRRYKPAGFQDAKQHPVKLKIVFSLMKMVLYIVGPKRFWDVSRLLVFLSSYRRLTGLWK